MLEFLARYGMSIVLLLIVIGLIALNWETITLALAYYDCGGDD